MATATPLSLFLSGCGFHMKRVTARQISKHVAPKSPRRHTFGAFEGRVVSHLIAIGSNTTLPLIFPFLLLSVSLSLSLSLTLSSIPALRLSLFTPTTPVPCD